MAAGFRLLSHTADLGIEAWGPTLPAALALAVRALGVVLAGEGAGHACERRSVRFTEEDEEALVVILLQESLYLLEAEGWLALEATLSWEQEGVLAGHLLGEPFDEARHGEGHPVKAVTWHRLAVERASEQVTLTVYLDL